MSRTQTEELNRYFKRATDASRRLKVAEKAHVRAITRLWMACDDRIGTMPYSRFSALYGMPAHVGRAVGKNMGIK